MPVDALQAVHLDEQSLHDEAPAPEYFIDPHALQVDEEVAPVADEYVPAEHFEHSFAPAAEYVPAEQVWHVAVPPAEYLPATHLVHVPAELLKPCPSLHFVHLPVDAVQALQVDEQSLHDEAPAAEYVIAPHALQLDAPAAE